MKMAWVVKVLFGKKVTMFQVTQLANNNEWKQSRVFSRPCLGLCYGWLQLRKLSPSLPPIHFISEKNKAVTSGLKRQLLRLEIVY